MNKKIKIEIAVGVILLITIIIGGAAWLAGQVAAPAPIIKTNPTVKSQGNDYFLTASLDKGNFVYGGAMQLAVNDLNDNILHDKLKLSLSDQKAQGLLDLFNNSAFNKNDLDEASYYIKSGYGQETVDAINKECRAKFPDKTFADLKLTLQSDTIIAYAYFLKKIEYLEQFKADKVNFLGQTVNGFRADSNSQKNNIDVVNYVNDDKFIVKLNLKDNSDEIYLAKGYVVDNPAQVIKDINQKATSATPMDSIDEFAAPNVHLDYQRNYQEFIGKFFTNSGFEAHYIEQMFENIKFDMDNKGARVENEAVIVAPTWAEPNKPKQIKKLILDKPYWIIMKRASSSNPYFILGIKNSELLEK